MQRKLITLTCSQCSMSFDVRADLKARFCSRRCYWDSRRVERIERICARCHEPFMTPPWWVERGQGIYCSRACFHGIGHDRFWWNVERESDCWRWIGGTNAKGYGRMSWGGRQTMAHRISWMIHYGPIPDGQEVLHKCIGGGNPWCVNPSHLALGTHKENMADMVAAGHSRTPRPGRPRRIH